MSKVKNNYRPKLSKGLEMISIKQKKQLLAKDIYFGLEQIFIKQKVTFLRGGGVKKKSGKFFLIDYELSENQKKSFFTVFWGDLEGTFNHGQLLSKDINLCHISFINQEHAFNCPFKLHTEAPTTRVK